MTPPPKPAMINSWVILMPSALTRLLIIFQLVFSIYQSSSGAYPSWSGSWKSTQPWKLRLSNCTEGLLIYCRARRSGCVMQGTTKYAFHRAASVIGWDAMSLPNARTGCRSLTDRVVGAICPPPINTVIDKDDGDLLARIAACTISAVPMGSRRHPGMCTQTCPDGLTPGRLPEHGRRR